MMYDLFNQDEPVNTGLSNKIDSYYSKDVRQKTISQKQRVFASIKVLKKASDRDIAQYTGISISLIPARRGSLLKDGLIEIAGTKIDKATNKTVATYSIVKRD